MPSLLPLFLFTGASSITPGPNNFMLLNSGLNFGIKRSLPHYLGICLGFPLVIFFTAVGLGAVFEHYAWVKTVLKWLGAAFLLYLSWQISRSCSTGPNEQEAKPFSFLQAAAFQWINPKAWFMGISVISMFTLSQDYLINAISISLFYFMVCSPCVGLWLFLGSALQKLLKNPVHRKRFNQAMGLCLALSIILIFIE